MSRAFIQKRLPFKPTDIGGCQLWLDAADSTSASMILSGSTVSTWKDKSSNGYTGTSSGSPTLVANSQNGLSCISFSAASSQYFNFGNILPQTPQSIFFVGKSTYVNGTSQCFIAKSLLGGQTGRWALLWDSSVGNYLNYLLETTAPVSSDTTGTITQYSGLCSLFEGVWDGTTKTLYGNGTQLGTNSVSSAGTSTTDLVLVGAYNNASGGVPPASGFYYNGTMCEILVFNNALTTSQRQQVESYLAQKWGLRQQLPQGHPGTRGIVYPSDQVNLLVRVPYQSAFLPTSISNCSMWLDGADPAGTGVKPSNGATVSTWIDKSGSGINLTAVGTPTYVSASSAVYLSGGAYMQNTNFNFTTYTIIIVIQTSGNAPVYTNTTSTPFSGFFPNFGGSIYLVSADNNWIGGTGLTTGITYLFTIQYDNLNNINLWSNGNTSPDSSGTTAGTITRNMFILGKRNSGGFTESMTGNVYEIVQYNTTLTLTQRQQVEGYLAWKWGLQANLPANHPYKNASPNITNQFGISRPPNVLPIPPITISARSKPTLQTITFTYTGSNQTFTVPSTISPASVTLYMWGAGGGGNTNYGGAGAMVQGILPVTPGETLTIVVGQGGTIDGSTTYGGGGAGGGNMAGGSAAGIGYSANGFPQNAGSGGGRSAIQRGGTDPTNDIIVAGGGGGGTYFSSDRGGAATFSGTANPGTGGLPGLGGTQSAGGAGGGTGQYGQGLGGSRGIGGNTYNTNIFNGGGGGGGGYWGGGGGGTNGGDGAGGGGGSSLTGGLSLISGQSVLGFNSTNGFTAPNTGSSYYQSGVGNGAPAINSSPRAGGNGLVVLIYNA